MTRTYTEIFHQRAWAYHRAMQEQPRARQRELAAAAACLEPAPGETVADAPAGGGYLRPYLPEDIRCIAVEPAPDFAGAIPSQPGDRILECPLEALELADAMLDGCVSLAGVHHLPDKSAFYREVARTLRPGGHFVLADVAAGSPVDAFLNGYCNNNCSMGHQGEFLDEHTAAELANARLRPVTDRVVECPWSFPDEQALAHFCMLLFGLDRAPGTAHVIEGIARHLGLESADAGVRMHWELRMLTCVRDR